MMIIRRRHDSAHPVPTNQPAQPTPSLQGCQQVLSAPAAVMLPCPPHVGRMPRLPHATRTNEITVGDVGCPRRKIRARWQGDGHEGSSLPPFKRLFPGKNASPQLRGIRLAVSVIPKGDNSVEGETVKIHIAARHLAAIWPADRLQRGYRYGYSSGHQSGCVAGIAIISYLAAYSSPKYSSKV